MSSIRSLSLTAPARPHGVHFRLPQGCSPRATDRSQRRDRALKILIRLATLKKVGRVGPHETLKHCVGPVGTRGYPTQ